MKKILMDFVLNLVALPWIILPTVIAYSCETSESLIPLVWIVPFYMVAINIYLSRQYINAFIIWRAVHCVLILVMGYEFTYRYIATYFINIGGEIDFWSELILQYEFIIGSCVVVIGLLIYQIVVLIKSKKTTQTIQ